tara:strand:- start:2800 stop:3672 length:873 start_codon:yes stop_codon:yes gene_type:complete
MATIKSEQFPFEAIDMSQNKSGGLTTTYIEQFLTIDRTFDKFGYGVSFVQDPASPKQIWNLQGEWNETLNNGRGGRDDYKGDKYQAGQQVSVMLQRRTYTKRDGTEGNSAEVLHGKIFLIDDDTTQIVKQSEEVGTVAQSSSTQDTHQQSIGKGQLLNLLTHSFPQDFGIFDGDKDKMQECIKYELTNLAQGLPLDFAYINTVTVNETEDMSIEDAGRLLEQIEKQEPLMEETVGDWTSKCVTIWKERYGDDESSQLQFTQWRTDNVGSRSQYENEMDYWKAIHKKLTGE